MTDTPNLDDIIAGIRYSMNIRADGQAVLWHDDEPIMVGEWDEVEREYFASLTDEQREALAIRSEVVATEYAEYTSERLLYYGAFEPECMYD